jgi:hypothetical protein
LIADRAYHGDQLAPQLGEKPLDRGCRQTLVGIIDHRIGDVVIGRKERGVFSAETESPFEKRNHGGEIVRRSSAGPSIVRCRKMRIRVRDVLCRDPNGSFEVAPHDADQGGIVGGKPIGARLQTIQKSSDCSCKPSSSTRGRSQGPLMAKEACAVCQILDRMAAHTRHRPNGLQAVLAVALRPLEALAI